MPITPISSSFNQRTPSSSSSECGDPNNPPTINHNRVLTAECVVGLNLLASTTAGGVVDVFTGWIIIAIGLAAVWVNLMANYTFTVYLI